MERWELLLTGVALALLLWRPRRWKERSLTQTQRDYGAAYETEPRRLRCRRHGGGLRTAEDVAVNEYLHVHYGSPAAVLSKALKGDTSLTSTLQRVKELCCQYAVRFGYALDVGCAVGGLSFLLSESFLHVHGVDTSRAFVDACCTLQRRSMPYVWCEVAANATRPSSARAERCSFACMDAMDFMKLGCKYDLILACNVLCRLRRPKALLELLVSCLAPAGVVVLVTPFAWLDAWTPREEWLGSTAAESSTALGELMARNGFLELHREELPFLLAQNERIYEFFVSELTAWKLA